MKELELLQEIEKMLKEEEMDCSIEPDVKAPPFGRLLVFFGNDTQGRERILEITAQDQLLGELITSPEKASTFTRVQFEVALPFYIKDYTSNEINSLLAFLNRMLELPGFEFDEFNSRIFYRHVMLTARKDIEKPLIMGIMGVIRMLLDLFSETIEQVGEGKQTFEDLLGEVIKAAEGMAK